MTELLEIIELLSKIDEYSNEYLGKDSKVQHHTTCILNEFMEVL